MRWYKNLTTTSLSGNVYDGKFELFTAISHRKNLTAWASSYAGTDHTKLRYSRRCGIAVSMLSLQSMKLRICRSTLNQERLCKSRASNFFFQNWWFLNRWWLMSNPHKVHKAFSLETVHKAFSLETWLYFADNHGMTNWKIGSAFMKKNFG